MRLAPIGLLAEGREQPVTGEFPHHPQAGAGDFTKPRLIAKFRNQIRVGNKHPDPAAKAQLENAGIGKFLRHAEQMADEPGLWNLMQIADQWQGLGWRWNGNTISHQIPRRLDSGRLGGSGQLVESPSAQLSISNVSPACPTKRSTSLPPSAAPGVQTPPGTFGTSFARQTAVAAIILEVEP